MRPECEVDVLVQQTLSRIYRGEISTSDLPDDAFGQAVWLKLVANSSVDPVDIGTIDVEEPVRLRKSNPPVTPYVQLKAMAEFRDVEAKHLALKADNLLTVSEKLEKGEKLEWYTEGLYLSPSTMAGLGNLCGGASKGCKDACLVTSGQADMGGKLGKDLSRMVQEASDIEQKYLDDEYRLNDNPTQFNAIIEARLRRTLLFMKNRKEFMELLNKSLVLLRARAKKKMGYKPCFRPNCVSDFPWEATSLFKDNPDLQIYDYTKSPMRYFSFLNTKVADLYATGQSVFPPFSDRSTPWPSNYYLTFSMSEVNFAYALIFIRMGGTVTIPFKIKADAEGVRRGFELWYDLPKQFIGQPVFDADNSDLRFLDNQLGPEETGMSGPYICGLRVKGVQQKREISENDFFLDVENFPSVWTSEDKHSFIVELLTLHVKRVRADPHYDKGTTLWLPTPEVFGHYVPELADTYKRIYEA